MTCSVLLPLVVGALSGVAFALACVGLVVAWRTCGRAAQRRCAPRDPWHQKVLDT